MIRVAVIGAGHMGEGHLRNYCRKEGVKLSFVCDPAETRGRKLAAEYSAEWTPYYRDVLDRIDAASIAVPTDLHHRVAADLLNRGIPVLLEKPIAATVAEAEDLVRLSRDKSVALQVGHIERFNPAVRKLSAELTAPRYLEIHRLGPFKGRGTDVSVVADLMIHDLDLVLDLVRSEPTEISALGLSAFTDSADIATARLVFEGGAVANLTASRISDKSLRKVRVFEPDRYWSLDCEQQELVCYRKKPDSFWRDKEKPTLADLIDRQVVPVEKKEPLALEIEAFLKIVKNGGKPEVSAEDGLRALRVASRIEHRLTENSLTQQKGGK